MLCSVEKKLENLICNDTLISINSLSSFDSLPCPTIEIPTKTLIIEREERGRYYVLMGHYALGIAYTHLIKYTDDIRECSNNWLNTDKKIKKELL